MKKRHAKTSSVSGKKKSGPRNSFPPKKVKGSEMKKGPKSQKRETEETNALTQRFKTFIDKDQEIFNAAEQKKSAYYESKRQYGSGRYEKTGDYRSYRERDDRPAYTNRYDDNRTENRSSYSDKEKREDRPYAKRNTGYTDVKKRVVVRNDDNRNENRSSFSDREKREDRPYAKRNTGYPEVKKRIVGRNDDNRSDNHSSYSDREKREDRPYAKRNTGYPEVKKRIVGRNDDNRSDNHSSYSDREKREDRPYAKRNTGYPEVKKRIVGRNDDNRSDNHSSYSDREKREDRPYAKRNTGYPEVKKRIVGRNDDNRSDNRSSYSDREKREERPYDKRSTEYPEVKKRITNRNEEGREKDQHPYQDRENDNTHYNDRQERNQKSVTEIKKRLIITTDQKSSADTGSNKREWEDRRDYSDSKGLIPKSYAKRSIERPTDRKRLTIQGRQDIKTPISVYEELRSSGMRLNKYVASAGISSRRHADELIAAGKITVNEEVIVAMGHKVFEKDIVKYNGKVLNPAPLVYVLLNKPKNIITTARDPEGRPTVIDLVKNATTERLYPVGRLDRNTTGLLLLTNDGELAQQLAHPSSEVPKIYYAILDRPLLKQDLEKISKGVLLEDGLATVDEIAYVNADDRSEVGISLHSGRNRVVRRIFEHIGYEVEKLDRVMYANLSKKDLPRGRWRMLAPKEVMGLKGFKAQKHYTPADDDTEEDA